MIELDPAFILRIPSPPYTDLDASFCFIPFRVDQSHSLTAPRLSIAALALNAVTFELVHVVKLAVHVPNFRYRSGFRCSTVFQETVNEL